MDVSERQLLVGVLLSLILLVRIVSHQEAGGMFRDQSDGLEREGRLLGYVARFAFLVGGVGGAFLWCWRAELVPLNLPLPVAAHWLGLGLVEAGVALLVWVQIALGVHFSGTLHLREGHQLVQHGPYARIRHPMYTSFLLLFTGLGLLTGNGLLAAIMLGSQVWVLGWRLPQEEAMLEQQFGDLWREYRGRTGAVLPR